MANDVVLNLLADVSSATKSIEDFTKQSSKSVQSIESSFKALGAVAVAAVSFLSARQIVRGLEAVVDAASKEQDAINDLNTALKLSGQFTQQASKGFQDFAQTIERTTKFSSEAVLESGSLIQSLARLDKEGLKKATQAAVDLSAALRIDLQTASTLVGKAAEGNIETFKRYGITIKKGADDAETFANTLDVLNKRFSGAAAAQVNTFSGAVAQLGNSFSDFEKSIGKIIIRNPVLIESVKQLTNLFRLLTESVEENQDSLTDLISDFIIFVSRIGPAVAETVGFISERFFALISVVNNVKEAFGVLTGNSQIIKNAQDANLALAESFNKFNDRIEIVKKSLEDIPKRLEAVRKASKGNLLPDDVSNLENQKPAAEEIGKTLGQGFLEVFEKSSSIGDLFSKSISFGVEKVFPKSGKTILKGFQFAVNAISGAIETGAKAFVQIIEGVIDVFKTAAGVISGILTGEFIKDITEVISKFGSIPISFLNAFKDLRKTINDLLKGLPQAIKEIQKDLPKIIKEIGKDLPKLFGTLAKAIPAIIDAFVFAIPKIVDAFVKALPDITQSIASSIPKIVDLFVKEVPKLVDAIIKDMPKIIKELNKAIPILVEVISKAALEFIKALKKEAPGIAEAFVKSLQTLFAGFIDALPDFIDILSIFLNKFIAGLPQAFKKLLQGLPAIITSLINLVVSAIVEFIKIIPDLIVIFAENIEPIIDAFTTGITFAVPLIVEAFIETMIKKGGIFRIAKALSIDLPVALIKGLGGFISVVGKDIGRDIARNVEPAFRSFIIALTNFRFDSLKVSLKLPDAFLNFADTLKEQFNKFIEKLKKALVPGGGGGSNSDGGIDKTTITPFAKGGFVPKGFPNDSFPAALTSGELVVPRDNVADFLSAQRRQASNTSGLDLGQLAALINNRPMIVNVQVGQEQLANAMYNVKKRGFRTA